MASACRGNNDYIYRVTKKIKDRHTNAQTHVCRQTKDEQSPEKIVYKIYQHYVLVMNFMKKKIKFPAENEISKCGAWAGNISMSRRVLSLKINIFITLTSIAFISTHTKWYCLKNSYDICNTFFVNNICLFFQQ